MSLYGDFKAGLLTDSEYTRACLEEYYAEKDSDWNEEEEFEDDPDEYELFFV